MRLFTDQDVYALTVRFLRGLGQEVQTAREASLSTATDEEITGHCASSGRVLITRDKDFGNLVFARGLICPAVVLIRSQVQVLDQTHAQLKGALNEIGSFDGIFLVIEPNRYRIRRVR